jgi:hypothetical protein
MQIPDRRVKQIAKLFSEIKQWNEFHPQTPLPCGFVDKLDEDIKYLEGHLGEPVNKFDHNRKTAEVDNEKYGQLL